MKWIAATRPLRRETESSAVSGTHGARGSYRSRSEAVARHDLHSEREFCFDMRWISCTMSAADSLKSRCYAEVTATSGTVAIAVRRHISAFSYSLNGYRVRPCSAARAAWGETPKSSEIGTQVSHRPVNSRISSRIMVARTEGKR
jgi:hypothetical protein